MCGIRREEHFYDEKALYKKALLCYTVKKQEGKMKMFKKITALFLCIVMGIGMTAGAQTLTREELEKLLEGYGISISDNENIEYHAIYSPSAPVQNPDAVSATLTSAGLEVNGIYQQSVTAYNILDNNYYKLRDLAYVLSGTEKQFEVTWDASRNAITLLSGKAYTPVGGEMEVPQKPTGLLSRKQKRDAVPTTATVFLDGNEIALKAYNIEGNNYFMLRDLGQALDCSVEWVPNMHLIRMDTAFGYVPEDTPDSYALHRFDPMLMNTEASYVRNWDSVSPVQQFSYMDEGLGYAYVEENMLKITTPSRMLEARFIYPLMEEPLLGDVIADDEGNFYVVCGRRNDSEDTDTDTVFISKYAPDGSHITTTGFRGDSVMGERGRTKIPFDAGNCASALHNGVLMVNYAREMYNGHQSNNVIGVHTDTMRPVVFDDVWDIPYTSHSFAQSVIWSNLAGEFVYADQGDAYDRGFVITTESDEKNIFHFYLPQNANYNMYIVNKTYAQMGGLGETDSTMVFAGASAKSIGAEAENEAQNLYIQFFDPNAETVAASMFRGGTARSGSTATDINDNNNAPMTAVTDYGVIWLTDYTDRDVISPRMVLAENRIFLFWTEADEDYACTGFYMEVDENGKVLTPATSLGRQIQNSHEAPIYHDGKLWWAGARDGLLRVYSLDI